MLSKATPSFIIKFSINMYFAFSFAAFLFLIYVILLIQKSILQAYISSLRKEFNAFTHDHSKIEKILIDYEKILFLFNLFHATFAGFLSVYVCNIIFLTVILVININCPQ
jgi:hypothetical protein